MSSGACQQRCPYRVTPKKRDSCESLTTLRESVHESPRAFFLLHQVCLARSAGYYLDRRAKHPIRAWHAADGSPSRSGSAGTCAGTGAVASGRADPATSRSGRCGARRRQFPPADTPGQASGAPACLRDKRAGAASSGGQTGSVDSLATSARAMASTLWSGGSRHRQSQAESATAFAIDRLYLADRGCPARSFRTGAGSDAGNLLVDVRRADRDAADGRAVRSITRFRWPVSGSGANHARTTRCVDGAHRPGSVQPRQDESGLHKGCCYRSCACAGAGSTAGNVAPPDRTGPGID
ncbi:hypothetical protein D3C73_942440 [compost metagenome]